MDEIPKENGGFIVILYTLFHVKDVYNHQLFDEAAAKRFRIDYDEEKILRICRGLKWALENRNIDYQNIFPKMKYSNEEILYFFERTYKEMQEVGICKKCV